MLTLSTPPMPARPYHHGTLRRALLDEAAALVQEGGAAAVTMRDLAVRAGVSRTAAYRHFEGKDGLLVAVAAEGFERLDAALRGAGAGLAGRARVEAMGRAYVRFALGHPAHYRLMYGRDALSRREAPELQAAADRAYDTLVALIAEEQAAGVLGAGDPGRLAYVAWSLVHGLALLIVDGQIEAPGDPDALAALAIGRLLDGLAR
jgi:AcrR family transcriptional regulator